MLTIPGVFWDTNHDDINNVEDGTDGVVTIMDDEIICITSPSGMEVRFTLHEFEAIYEYAIAEKINDLSEVQVDSKTLKTQLSDFNPFRQNT